MVSAYSDKLKAMRESLEASKKTPKDLTGTIDHIEAMTAGEVYGESAKDPTREVIQVYVKVDQTGDVFKVAFTLPFGSISWRNAEFKLGKFVAKYGDLPEPGTVVNVELGRNGFYDLVI